MVGSVVRLAAAAAFSAILAGCAGPSDGYGGGYDGGDYRDSGGTAPPDAPLQCVPFARDRAGIPIYGDAYTWWDQAAGRYARSSTPSAGAVMVLYAYAGPDRAHLAVVREIVDDRDIRVDHANWLDDGGVYLDNLVRDVSQANDWSQVRVFNVKTGSWGTKVYPVQGFIGPGPDTDRLHLAQNPAAAPRHPDPIADLLAQNAAPDDEDN